MCLVSKSKSKRVKRTRIKLPRSVHQLFPEVTEAYDAVKAVEVAVETRDC